MKGLLLRISSSCKACNAALGLHPSLVRVKIDILNVCVSEVFFLPKVAVSRVLGVLYSPTR